MTDDAMLTARSSVAVKAVSSAYGQEEAVCSTGRQEKTRRRLDPRISIGVLVHFNVVAFLSTALPIEIAAVLFNVALMIALKRPRMALVGVAIYLALAGVWFACIMAGPTFAPIGSCFLMLRRFAPTVMFAMTMISTTYVSEMAYALQSVGLSSRVTVAVCVALRFFPTAFREARAVREAMLTRGIRLTPLTLIRHPLSLLENFMVPFIHRISMVADELGDAVMVRAIESPNKRTCFYELKIGILDVAVVVAACAIFALALLERIM